jgi:protein phosphatase
MLDLPRPGGSSIGLVTAHLLTIGAFARAARVSPKALRRYDELGLLPPAHVDDATGYRYYRPEQVARARLVVWLRRIGMPPAEIARTCALDGAEAADAVARFWAGVEAETAERRELATFLVAHLSGAGAAPAAPGEARLVLRYAVRSDVGLVRPGNQDSVHASARLLAVADGFGPAGAPASAAAVETLARLTAGPAPLTGDVLNVLHDAVEAADRAVGSLPGGADGAGTTLTALVWTGAGLALVHVGDSRAYLLRDGGFFRITHDQTVVQAMVDAGRLTAAEATTHPQRAMLLQALGSGPAPQPQVRRHDVRGGDRFLLCSDGLSSVVPDADVRGVLAGTPEPEHAVDALVALAHDAGAPDNVSCVVADVVATGQVGGTPGGGVGP